jgi:hypothetical protein
MATKEEIGRQKVILASVNDRLSGLCGLPVELSFLLFEFVLGMEKT